ncbi:type VI secretion system Vgr family protein [Dyella flava]|uniref:type VI secretion system Vgr family protein n=1 Tax=Dyella flava TaxID=1920170 RepID=UPI00195CC72F|nr:type VI secretion system Vgr family protein [Dyella flava]
MTSLAQISQAYHLHIAGTQALFSVQSFKGKEALSTPYRFEIDVTCAAADLATASVLGKTASFTIQPIDTAAASLRRLVGELADTLAAPAPARLFRGLITQFDQLDTSADQTHYRLVLEPRLADLSREVTSRLFQKRSAPEILEDVLRHAGFTANDFQFTLRAGYPTREYTTQYDETTLAFLQRIAADEGIWFRVIPTDDRDVIVFGDDIDAYQRSGLSVPLRADAGLESAGAEAITSLTQQRRRVTQAVRLHDNNPRTTGVSLLTDANVARDDRTTAGTDYRWGEHPTDPEDAQRLARLRHQAHLTQQIVYDGTGNVLALAPGSVLRLRDKPLPDASHGLMITAVTHTAARDQPYINTFTAIPADRPYRSQPLPWPSINGLLPARIVSPGNYKYAYLTQDGEYRVQLPFDLDSWSPGGSSRPVRLAKPYSGRDYGHHFPLIDGAEVILGFTQGDPDRPTIVGAVHNSQRTDLVTHQNNTRNLIRTAAGNELRMEDYQGVEHIHLSTPTQTSELNLGHMVDGQNTPRGIGAELRTDGHASVRAAKGVFVSADAQPGAHGQQLEMQAAIGQLQQALAQTQALTEAAQAAQAIAADYRKQKDLFEQSLDQLKKAGILISAPDGIGLTTGGSLQLNAAQNLIASAGGHLDVGVMKRITVAAGELVSVFAQKLGIKLFAAKGKVEIQAQSDAMQLLADQNMTITSVNGRVTIEAKDELLLKCGGSYFRMSATGIEEGTRGDRTIKSAAFARQGPSFVAQHMNSLPSTAFNDPYVLRSKITGEVLKQQPYEIVRADGTRIKGTTDDLGRTSIQKSHDVEDVVIRVPPHHGGST